MSRLDEIYQEEMREKRQQVRDAARHSVTDWTCNEEGIANSSTEYKRLQVEIAKLIRNSAHSLLCGDAETVAGIILSQLTYIHGFAPRVSTTTQR